MAGSSKDHLKELAEVLYAKCSNEFPADHHFYQTDLVKLNVVPGNDIPLLLEVAQSLVNQNLLRLSHGKDDRLVWTVISKEDAAKYKGLDADETLAYNVIQSSGRTGVWTRTIKARTNLHQSVLTRCLKSLETKSYIKAVRNVKYPSRKIYMLYGLQPSEDVTGGAWFTDGVLDTEFIRMLGIQIEHWVSEKSWYEVKHANTNDTINTNGKRSRASTNAKSYLPFPPGYKAYPTISEITKMINSSNITNVHMSESDISDLLDVLVFDNKLHKVRHETQFKAVLKPNELNERDVEIEITAGKGGLSKFETLGGNGMTEAPCGNCPVFEICEDGAPVNPANCQYFDEWLKKGLEF